MTEDHVKEIAREEPTAGRFLAGIRRASEALGLFVLGFLFAGTAFPFSSFPLGTALVAAMPRDLFFGAAGICLRCIYAFAMGENLFLVGASAFLVCGARLFFAVAVYGRTGYRTAHGLADAVPTRVLIGAVSALGFALLRAMTDGISLSEIASLAVETVCTAAFSFLFAYFLDAYETDSPAATAGLGAFAFCVALSLGTVEIGGFSVGLVVSYIGTLLAGYREGAAKSAVVGLLCGLACGGIYAPVFALSGLVAGIFFDVNCLLAGLGSLTVMICGGLYFGGIDSLSAFLPEVVTAASVMTAACALHWIPAKRKGAGDAECRALLLRRRKEEEERRLDAMSKSMNALSAALAALSEQFKAPAPDTLTESCVKIWKRHCEGCPNECRCHEIESVEAEGLSGRLASRLMAAGKLDRERLYEITGTSCPKLGEIAAALNDATAKLLEEAIRTDKTGIFARDYEAAAQMFSDAVSESNFRFSVDKILSERLRKAFLRAGLRAENLLVCGNRRKTVIATGNEVTATRLRPGEMQKLCATVCGTPFCPPSFMLEDGKSAVTLESESPYYVEYAGRQLSKKGEHVCGDSVSVVKNDDGYFYCFICDGMGSGEEAALTSRISRTFLEKMLACGNRKATTLEMLNSFLCAKRGESFATVDLLEVDLVLGIASFVKSGAVPSYIIRDRHLYKIASGTFPVGILPQVSAEVTEFELRDGDVILLCSDGVASDIEASEAADPTWFLELIESAWTDRLGVMATRILEAASNAAVRSDDMTVELIRLRRKEGAAETEIAS